ncbi:MAG: c-type cytochrome [Anaerolineae bacterium]
MALAACGGQATPEPAQEVFQPTQAPATQPPAATEAPAEVEAPAATEAPAEAEAPAEPEVPEVELFGDPIRGGVLYDKWWPPLGLDTPAGDHPLWATQSTNARSGADTWRCKECHGWDYKGADGAYGSGSHFTGFAGVLSAVDKGPGYVLGALQGETDPDHDFSTVMDEQALTDLALFILEETMDYDPFVGPDKMALGGDLALGEELFQDCADCHGPQGTAINFKNVAEPEYVGGLAQDNPWEFLHKLRFGQPTEPDMPSAVDIGWSEDEQLAVLAYAQSLPALSPVSEGGLLYDKWWKALGAEEPEGDQPLWATQSSNARSGADTWRCKECHGWDYRGADGAYGSGSHFTGFTGVLGAASMSTEELSGWLNGAANPDHDFSAYLDDEQINRLVTFMQEGLVDISLYINDDKTVNGDPQHGQTLYNAACKRCHGETGVGEAFVLSILANDNPWEVFHKISNGQPGEHMPAGVNFGWSPQDIADLLSYAQTLPVE